MTSTWDDFEKELADIDVDAIVAEESGNRPNEMLDMTNMILDSLEKFDPTEQEKVIFSTSTVNMSDDSFDHLMAEAYLAAQKRREYVMAQPEDEWVANRTEAHKYMTILNALGLFISVETLKRRWVVAEATDEQLDTLMMAIVQTTLAVAMNQAMFAWSFKTDEDGTLDAVCHLMDPRTGELLHWLCI